MDNRSIKAGWILSWIFVILWMVIIINLSSQVADRSNQLSTGVTDAFLKTIKHIFPQADPDIIILNAIIRKSAHFFNYMIMAVLLLNAFRRSRTNRSGIVPVLGICVIFAVLDEGLQLFIEGRGAQFMDVVIDSIGAICGIILYLFISKLLRDQKHEGDFC